MKKALITGITGQDGYYLAKFLLENDYTVYGLRRRSSSFENTWRIDQLILNYQDKLKLIYADLTDSMSIVNAINSTSPDEIYNLGAQSHVGVSFVNPEYTAQVDGLGTLRILEAVRSLGRAETTKIYQASTSELYGKVQQVPQNEATPFYPRSPYAVAKIYGYWILVNYREAYNMYACNGILFNHESPIRGENFVTRKITLGLAKIYHGLIKNIYLGNLDAMRDWGHARDYVEMMYLMLQQSEPKDYVIATGLQYSVREFVRKSAAVLGIELEFEGTGVEERAVVTKAPADSEIRIGQTIIKISPKYFRPTEVDTLLGDPSLAMRDLGWQPKTSIDELAKEMVNADFKRIYNIKNKGS